MSWSVSPFSAKTSACCLRSCSSTALRWVDSAFATFARMSASVSPLSARTLLCSVRSFSSSVLRVVSSAAATFLWMSSSMRPASLSVLFCSSRSRSSKGFIRESSISRNRLSKSPLSWRSRLTFSSASTLSCSSNFLRSFSSSYFSASSRSLRAISLVSIPASIFNIPASASGLG